MPSSRTWSKLESRFFRWTRQLLYAGWWHALDDRLRAIEGDFRLASVELSRVRERVRAIELRTTDDGK